MTDPTPEDVERGAKALWENGVFAKFPSATDWEHAPADQRMYCLKRAKIVLAAAPDHSALIRELRDALKKWGSHNGWCASNKWPAPGNGFAPCDCGFATALRKANEALGEEA